jgi:hypothetical protein
VLLLKLKDLKHKNHISGIFTLKICPTLVCIYSATMWSFGGNFLFHLMETFVWAKKCSRRNIIGSEGRKLVFHSPGLSRLISLELGPYFSDFQDVMARVVGF